MMYRAISAVAGALLAVGCSSSPVDVTTSSGSAGTTTGSGAGGASTTTGSGGGGGATCGAVQLDPAAFELTIHGSPALTQPLPIDTTVEGKVIASGPGTVTIDTCPPTMACPAVPATLKVTAPNLPSVLVPSGAWVRLHVRVEATTNSISVGSQTQVLIENLPDWMGASNSISTTNRVWFAAFTSGTPVGSPPSFVPFSVGETRCGACFPPDNRESLSITFPGATAIDVPTGQQRSFDVTGPLAAHYVIQGLHALRDCEGNGVVSYWLTGA